MSHGRKASITTNNNSQPPPTRILRSSRKRKNEEAQEPPVLVNTTTRDKVAANEATTSQEVANVNGNKTKATATNKPKAQRGGRNKKRKVEDTDESFNNELQKEEENNDLQANVQEVQEAVNHTDLRENNTKGKGKSHEGSTIDLEITIQKKEDNTSQELPKSKEHRGRDNKAPQEEDSSEQPNITQINENNVTSLPQDTPNQQEDNNIDAEKPNGKGRRGQKKRTRNDDETNIEQNERIPTNDDDIIITSSHNTRNAAKKRKKNNTDNGVKLENPALLEEPRTDSMEIKETVAAYLTTNPKSELTGIDMKFFMKTIFCEKRYKKFTKEQKARLIGLVPSVDKVPIIKNNSEKGKEKMEIDEPIEIDEQLELEYLMKYSDQAEIPNASSSFDITSFASSSKDIVTVDSASLPAESAADTDASDIVKVVDLTAENAEIVTIDGADFPAESANSVSFKIEDHGKGLPAVAAESTTINNNKRPKEKIRQYFFNDMQFYGCVKAFKEKLSWNHFDPKWIKRNQANQKRLKNIMDEDWKWGHNLVSKSPLLAGDSASLSLQDLCKAAIIRAGDELHYKRTFNKANAVVEGVVKVIDIKPDGTMYVVNQSKTPQQSPAKQPAKRGSKPKDTTTVQTPVIASSSSTFTTNNTTIETPLSITTISSLETKVLDDDARVSKQQRPNGNAYKSFRLVRAGRNLGTIFALRSEYYEKTHRLIIY
ncbi:1342_t:CDS:2 [Ambispora gerdemannii]|uniref:1342_t:CDS:1 n=1 Tax=Ambispora gerdemannii TaxID=144530 RepID=A0A9N9DJC5_9GLOM|nr:1342_t:CDS:2 [Ambispora gerdemannii]